MAESPEGVEMLKSFQVASFTGAAVPVRSFSRRGDQTDLQQDLGDRLTAQGVRLFTTYGTTETGSVLTSKRDFVNDHDWNWVRAEGLIVPYLSMEDRGGGLWECCVKDGYPMKTGQLMNCLIGQP